ncbi:peptidoglycan-binding protein [Niveomyces insectorum RCEF 264]|uniref:Peptidoglycan-binding protein n=1 Tax=Niveomyces insectorum RCEF 264 TaxID=1081102 RepID=A0A167QWR8_9HYPO|nr:peptidoglycan-binding protein [Niveomyces insectorum RCEF 264]
MFSSSGAHPPDAESATARPRNRRPRAAVATDAATTTAGSSVRTGSHAYPYGDAAGRRSGSRLLDGASGDDDSVRGFGASLLSPGPAASWVPNWSSIQEFASTLLAGGGNGGGGGGGGGGSSGGARSQRSSSRRSARSRKLPEEWGPVPPGGSSSSTPSLLSPSLRPPRLQDVAAGRVAAREAELKARKTASVLESHPGVNGGLDVRGKFKRRTSDDNLRGSASASASAAASASASTYGSGAGQEVEDCLVYVHRVQASDTYFGIILKFRCREDAFRRANGLWSRDNIQVRKWVALPVDACEVKGRPCDDPSLVPQGAKSPQSVVRSSPQYPGQTGGSGLDSSDYFGLASFDPARASGRAGTGTPNTTATATATAEAAGEPPWTHVRWVCLDSCPEPVEIVRMSRTALGFFPPRRKKSLRGSVSTLSTPRASLEVSLSNSSVPERSTGASPNRVSRRASLLGNRAAFGTSPMSSSSSPLRTAGPSVSAAGGAGNDPRPEWMRRSGGVGTMGKSVRAPGPAQDSLTKWTTKHIPSLNVETLPSMSVMGSETAHFGFGGGDEAPNIVESSFEDGRAVASMDRQDSGLDKAATAIETWLRGAFTKPMGASHAAGTPPASSFAGKLGRRLEETLGDLIELEDGRGEDGAALSDNGEGTGSASARPTAATGWRTDSEGSIRGRSTVAAGTGTGRPVARSTTKGKKAD